MSVRTNRATFGRKSVDTELIGRAQHGDEEAFASLAAGVGDVRFGCILRRKGRHHLGAHVGRIGQDEIVFPPRQFREQIGTHQRDPFAKVICADITLRHG